MKRHPVLILLVTTLLLSLTFHLSNAWYDETHIAVAKTAGYVKWFNACGPDMIRVKLGDREGDNHFVNNPRGTSVTSKMVKDQIPKYDTVDPEGHLYGAIIATIRDYVSGGTYAEYHLAFCAHYVGDLSQPLHNIEYDAFNKEYHSAVDGIVNDEVLQNLDKIKIYPVNITSEEDIIGQVVRMANQSRVLGYKLEDERRILTKKEAYQQISHSASLLKAILGYARKVAPVENSNLQSY